MTTERGHTARRAEGVDSETDTVSETDECSPEGTGTDQAAVTDGGTTDRTRAQSVHENTDYLEQEVNLFKPSTPFMRDNLRMMFLLFGAWLILVFGPVTASLVAEDFMTETTVLGGFPLNFFLTAIVSPLSALVLAAVYAWYRDRLDTKYGISHADTTDTDQSVATDGGSQ